MKRAQPAWAGSYTSSPRNFTRFAEHHRKRNPGDVSPDQEPYSAANFREVPTGEKVFDWNVPKEWNIRDAYIADSRGHRLVDFRKCNLHVMNYSIRCTRPCRSAISVRICLAFRIILQWIPYRTSYYEEDWGFCLSHNQMLALEDGEYEVCIDSTLTNGHLTFGECLSTRPVQ